MPGYWDGELALQIEKTPIISRNIGGKKHVGIGTMPDEYYQFKVGGNMRVEPDQDDKVVFSVGSKDGEQSFMQVLHNGSLVVGGKDYPHSPLHIQGNDQAGGHLYFYNGTNYNKGWVLLKRGENFPSKNSLLFSYYNGKGWDESLYLHPDGNAAFQQRVEDKTGPIMPVGAIVMWSGTKSTIPKGWVLCDGGNGTPDLRDRFVVGAGKSYNAKSTGGANKVTLKQTEMPKHSHSGRTDNQSVINTGDNKNYQLMHPNTYNRKFDNGKYTGYDRGGRDAKTLGNSLKDPHNHSFKTSTSGGGNAHENRPPYFALCFIMKT
jgi:microcystin-dependent protein